jgi:hypothetical protein
MVRYSPPRGWGCSWHTRRPSSSWPATSATLAIHLAALAAESQKVMVMDLDPQGSALEWASRRGDRPPDITAVHPASLAKEIERGREDNRTVRIAQTFDFLWLMVARSAPQPGWPSIPRASIGIGGDRCHVADDTVHPAGGASRYAGHSREARRATASRGKSPR